MSAAMPKARWRKYDAQGQAPLQPTAQQPLTVTGRNIFKTQSHKKGANQGRRTVQHKQQRTKMKPPRRRICRRQLLQDLSD
jgi:hypothetical protein